MSTLTPNYGLHLPENTDSMDDFFTNYESDMTTIDDHLGSGGGATIEEMTQAEYEALPDTKKTDGILRGLKDVKSFLDADILYLGTCYSLSERMVGCWIDGKPLYTKTVNFGTLPNNTTKTVSHGVANVDKIWIAGGFAFQPNGDFVNQLSLYVPNSNAGWYIGVNSTSIECYTVTDRSNYSAFVVLYYTKTTDVAGSGTWTPSGVNAVHYDTNEQVIGTWIDGKTLYRKILTPTVNVGPNTISHGIANLDECISIRGMCKYNNTNEQLPLPYVSTNSSYVIALGNVTATTYLVDVESGFSSIQDCKIIMEYTKSS